MPRKYKRTLGSRPYANYSSETLEECLRAIRSKEITQRAAEETCVVISIEVKIKKHKVNRSMVMKTAMSKRWKDTNRSVESRSSNEPMANNIPNALQFEDNFRPNHTNLGPSNEPHSPIAQSTNSSYEEDESLQKKERPRGFEIVSSYRPNVNVHDDASVYCPMDLR
ncbi:hypothetical protein J6590_101525 [Homalodisca vitripennis]|nr:hypothetical protein J6590_101525 [Homalodisca vitripennis]